MNSKDETNLEKYRATWRREAHERAVKEADQAGRGADREVFIRKREGEIYAELEKLGMKDLH